MKKSIIGFVAALLVCGTAFAADVAPNENTQSPATPPGEQAPVVAAEPEPVVKRAKSGKASKTARPYDLDLRHCLELTDNVAIAKCAGE